MHDSTGEYSSVFNLTPILFFLTSKKYIYFLYSSILTEIFNINFFKEFEIFPWKKKRFRRNFKLN